MTRRRPSTPRPVKRRNPSGRTVWQARYPARDGGWPSAGAYAKKSEAQAAIDAAMDREWSATTKDTFGAYADTWIDRRPRGRRTNITNASRIRSVRKLRIEGIALEDWRFADLRRRHAFELVERMLVDQRRTHTGVQNIMRTLSAMAEDALSDEVIELNPWRGVKVRANDPRIRTTRRPKRVWSWADMHAFARASGRWEPAVRVLSDCGLRVSEMLALQHEDVDFDAGMLTIRRTLDLDGTVLDGTKTTHDSDGDGGRRVPIPEDLLQMLWSMDRRVGTPLLFPNERGRPKILRNFYRDVWERAQRATGLDIRPHEMRHSWITHLAAAGVDVADLAAMAGHTVETANAHYRHAKYESYDKVRGLIG